MLPVKFIFLVTVTASDDEKVEISGLVRGGSRISNGVVRGREDHLAWGHHFGLDGASLGSSGSQGRGFFFK